MKDHYKSAWTTGLRKGDSANRDVRTAIVRVGHPALDAALASERATVPGLGELREACRRGTEAAPQPHTETRSSSPGRPADGLALTLDRGGRGPTLHVSTTHTVVDAGGRARQIRVWHELATFDCN